MSKGSDSSPMMPLRTQGKTGTVYPYVTGRPGQRPENLTFSPLYSGETRFYKLLSDNFSPFRIMGGYLSAHDPTLRFFLGRPCISQQKKLSTMPGHEHWQEARRIRHTTGTASTSLRSGLLFLLGSRWRFRERVRATQGKVRVEQRNQPGHRRVVDSRSGISYSERQVHWQRALAEVKATASTAQDRRQ